MQLRQRARLRPGPFLPPLLLAATLLMQASLHAHDPGLSALDVQVTGEVVSAVLSISRQDLQTLALGSGGAATPDADWAALVRQLAQRAVHLWLDDRPLPVEIGSVAVTSEGAEVRLEFAVASSVWDGDSGAPVLHLRSDVPGLLARGHRELVIVRAGERVVAERLLDARGSEVTVRLKPDDAVRLKPDTTYVVLGLRHILSGFDHLVFVAGLLLASGTLRRLAGLLTAFTAAHSVTLALAATGTVHLPSSFVEPVIAASIAWVGVENLRRPRSGPRWLVVFAFGLIHGFGFAGALTGLGLGDTAASLVRSLLSFNVGVEAGQLGVALILWPLVRGLRARRSWHLATMPACSALIVIAGGYWLVARLAG